MTAVTFSEIERDLRGHLRKVVAGESLLIVDGSRPIAELRPVELAGSGHRPFGLCAGEFTVPDDFDAPLPDEVIAAFEGR